MKETVRTALKEKTSPPPFRVSRMDEAWAYEYGLQMKQNLAAWKDKGYPFNAPEALRPYFDGRMTDDAFKTTLHEWYEKWDTTAEVRRLLECEPVFNRGIAQYLPLQSWGFEIPDSYDVVVTPFAIGAGGAGQQLEGHGPVITMWYGRQWGKRDRTPEETLLHEAYHLGADKIIEAELRDRIPDEKKYQRIKERIVDWCSAEVLTPHVLPAYHFQFSEVPGLPHEHPINDFLQQSVLPVPQRLRNYAQSLSG